MANHMLMNILRWVKGKEGRRHALVWLSIFIVSLASQSFIRPFGEILARTVITGIIFIFIYYANAFYFVPYFLSRKRTLVYIFFTIGFLVLFTYIRYLIDLYLLGINLSLIKESTPDPWKWIVYVYWNVNNFVYYLGLIYALNKNWHLEKARYGEVVREKSIAELKLLKQQLNPHFLLNTLNNIYSLSYRGKPEASDMILKLSESMKYMLYESEGEWVALDHELKFIKNYVELNLLRMDDPSQVEWCLTGSTNGLKIAPLLLIPLVENAFKYGDLQHQDQRIRITIAIEKGILIFETINDVRSTPNFYEKSGIGLNNVQKRLELTYKGRYSLDTSDDGKVFKLKLQIQL